MKIIALEESFWYEKLATEGSTVSPRAGKERGGRRLAA